MKKVKSNTNLTRTSTVRKNAKQQYVAVGVAVG